MTKTAAIITALAVIAGNVFAGAGVEEHFGVFGWYCTLPVNLLTTICAGYVAFVAWSKD